MKYAEYLNACITFAEDSRKWGNLVEESYYTTTDNGGGEWAETCDNAHGGISVAWAFHLTVAQIKDRAPQQYADAILERWQLSIDNGLDDESASAAVAFFEGRTHWESD